MAFLKWAGSKRTIISDIQSVLKDYPRSRFLEPFVGGGSVFSSIGDGYDEVVINDLNKNLISVYKNLQENPSKFIVDCEALFTDSNNTKEAFEAIKAHYNELEDGSYDKAVIFVYLNKHGFNGMYRVNKKGKYNIPFARYKTVNFNHEKIMNFARGLALANITILSTDYRDILNMAKACDVVYCDPPYTPLSKTASFSQYTDSVFGAKQQEELVKMAEVAAQNGATVLISNHDTPETRTLYANARIVEVSVRRSIGAHASTRKHVDELIAVYSRA